jgi:molecular chaperone DnaK
MGRVVGIDLGTTNTAVAVLVDGKPKVLEDERGYKVLPSCVSSKGDGRFIVGHAAYNLILTRPGRTVYATKRLIGRRFDSPEVQEARKRMQYQLREAPDGGVQVQVGDAWMSPVEVAAIILQVVKSVAERSLGDTVESCIVTVPAYFNHAQRQATLEAANLAGLHCERLLNEPTAAALAYGFKKTINKTVLVFDLGGGTFDVSILRVGDGLYETLATVGDTYLGGEDFDFRIVDWIAAEFQKMRGVDLRSDRHTLQRLKDAAERAKCELSFADRTIVSVPHVTPTDNLELPFTRANLESITADLVERCLEVCRKAVQEAGLSLATIDEVILVGGQSRMPRLRAAVTTLFGKEPSRAVHPEEAVAVGASIHAGSLDDPEVPGAVLLDVTPFDLGIDAAGGLFTPVVQRNSRVPCSETRTFVTARDNQDTVKIVVRQGASRVASENEFLGEFVMAGLTLAPRFQTRVDVSFRLDTNGILHVTAIEKGTGERKQITIRNYAQRATEPAMPSAEEAKEDRTRRSQETVVAEVTPAPVTAPPESVKKKAGFFDSLFGRKKAPEKPSKPAKAPEPAPPVPEQVAAKSAEPAQPSLIDLSTITPPPEEATITPLDLEEPLVDDLEETQPARLGLAGESAAPQQPVDPFAQPIRSQAPSSSKAQPASLLDASLFDENTSVDDLYNSLTQDLNSKEASEEDDAFFLGDGLPQEGELVSFQDLPDQDAPPLFLGGEQKEEPLFLGGERKASQEGKTPKEEPLFLGGERKASQEGKSLKEETLFLGGPEDDSGSLADELARQLEDDSGKLSHPYPSEDDDTPDAPLSSGGAKGIGRTIAPPSSDLDGISEDLLSAFSTAPAVPAKTGKPARIKLNYKRFDVFAAEYRENLRRGGAFIKTEKPLQVGRSCVFEIRVPGVPDPVVFDAVVTSTQDGKDGREAGMGVEYRMDERQRMHVERLLKA